MDEAQLELSRNLVSDFKTFKFVEGNEESEKEAKKLAEEFKRQRQEETGRMYSELGHMANYYYVGYARAGELASICAKKAGEFYGLNVEMGADYALGANWAACH